MAAALVVSLTELQQLRSFLRFRGLPTAVVGHIAADHQAQRRSDLVAGATQARRSAADRLGPDMLGNPVQSGDVAPHVLVRLSFLLAIGAEPVAHAAGVHVIGE